MGNVDHTRYAEIMDLLLVLSSRAKFDIKSLLDVEISVELFQPESIRGVKHRDE